MPDIVCLFFFGTDLGKLAKVKLDYQMVLHTTLGIKDRSCPILRLSHRGDTTGNVKKLDLMPGNAVGLATPGGFRASSDAAKNSRRMALPCVVIPDICHELWRQRTSLVNPIGHGHQTRKVGSELDPENSLKLLCAMNHLSRNIVEADGAETLLGRAIKQRMQSSHVPSRHRHMVIATTLSMHVLPCCTAAQTRLVLSVAFEPTTRGGY